jgi:hypothetical protein
MKAFILLSIISLLSCSKDEPVSINPKRAFLCGGFKTTLTRMQLFYLASGMASRGKNARLSSLDMALNIKESSLFYFRTLAVNLSLKSKSSEIVSFRDDLKLIVKKIEKLNLEKIDSDFSKTLENVKNLLDDIDKVYRLRCGDLNIKYGPQ